jgi:hypothetical protein
MSKKAMAKIVKISKTKLKEDFSTHKIELSKMDDVQEAIDRAFYLKEEFEQAYDDARDKVILASDIIRFDWNDAIVEGESILDELETAIDDLGIDMPNELKQFRKQLEELESDREVADGKLDGVGK